MRSSWLRRRLCRGACPKGRRAHALLNIQEAIRAYPESLEAHDEPIPLSISEEVVEVAV